MMKNSYEVRAQKFIEKIYPYLPEDMENVNAVKVAMRRFSEECRRRVKVDYGASRIVLISSDYVIKIDRGTTHWGNCASEMAVYERAKEDGYDYLLAKISRYICNGHAFYIMPRISRVGGNRGLWDALTGEEKAWVDNLIADLHGDNYGWKDGNPVIIDYACVRDY